MSDRPLSVLVLEPYYGGSHRAVLDLLVRDLSARGFNFDLLTLPPRKWKWRMRGSAITMAEEARRLAGDQRKPRWDLIFASTFVNLAEFVTLAGEVVLGVPRIVYFHENQLLYPNRHTAEWDYQFPLTNITSALCADRCLFNSRYNLEGFLDAIPAFLKEFPDHQPKGVAERIAARSQVLPPPFDPAAFERAPLVRGDRPRVVWPHRWEHDKDPEALFEALTTLAAEGLDFEVAVGGQSFRETEEHMGAQAASLGERIVHLGEPEDRDAYAQLLRSSDIAVSTARNEFFGVAMMEACFAGCAPVVPDRLAYPEFYANHWRYADGGELVARLRALVLDRPKPGIAEDIARPFTIDALAPRYAEVFREVAGI